jgi:cell fate regulator YaaT (PSP1 superfamily)
MKLLKTYIPLDGSKVFFYYIAEQRVDFRALVRDLMLRRKRIQPNFCGATAGLCPVGEGREKI